MTKRLLILIALLGSQISMSATLNGTVTDKNGEGIPGANVYIKDTYDGATTNVAGQFSFDTEETGNQVLITSFIGYKALEQDVNLSNEINLDIVLKESANKLTGVTITAGSFEASDENKSVILKPLDIAMTAGATADIAGALNTLPGTTTNGETGQLFVRGGTANETKAFVNGMLVHNFYNAAPANMPSRGRFSPFLFKGTYFSAGGYSAEYGQALSSVLSLNSIDLPEENKTDLSFMSVGGGIAHVQKWKKSAVSAQLNYTNLDPYIGLVDQAFNWEDGFTSTSGTLMYWHHINKSDRLKVYANFDQSDFIINIPNINHLDTEDRVDLTNKNIYINTAYLKTLGDKSMLFTGVSVGNTVEHINLNQDVIKEEDQSIHLKSYVNSEINESLSFKLGGEIIRSSKRQDADIFNDELFISKYENDLVVGFLESDYYINNKLTVRAGVRAANYSLYNKSKVSPRLSMAYKTSQNAQISLAYGKFHQLPESETLIRSNQALFEESDHYLANYQIVKNKRTFRIEGYFKNYRSLVKYDGADSFNPLAYNNTGDGFAKGVDVFFKDNKSIKNGQFWISYSLIDTERDHQDFPTTATPSVAAKHNFSLVGKYFLTRLKTQVGATFSYNSGRPYDNPNEEGFNASQTKSYQNLSFNFAYLPKQNVVIYASATNLLGRDNIFGYQYENEAGFDGVFNSMPTGQAAKRFLFLGVFITLTKDKTKNQLESLD
jgi:hypothetical protein